MKKLIILLALLALTACAYMPYYAWADTTVIQNKGMPVASAMAPSMSAFSQDVCAVPVSGAGNFGVVSVSGGTVMFD
jgi:hypothetical protein